MRKFKAAFLNEIYKISKKKKLIAAAVLSLIAVLVAGVAVFSLKNFVGINVTGSSEFSVMVLSVLSVTLIPLFTAFIAIDMFTGEINDNTMRLTLTCPVSRLKVFSAKVLSVASFVLGNLLLIMVLSIITLLVVSGPNLAIGKTVIAYLVTFFPLLVFALFVTLIANFAKGTTSAFMLTVLLYIGFFAAGMFFPTIQSFLFTSAFDWYTLFLGSYFNVQKVIRVAVILAGYSVMLFCAGYYLFEKREL